MDQMFSHAAADLVRGSVDMHVHSAPDNLPRKVDDFELADEVIRAAMRGAVIKDHLGSSAARAILANKRAGRETLFGSITLNLYAGGLNPFAVEAAARLGAKLVWMPTIHARNHIETYRDPALRLSPSPVAWNPARRGLCLLAEDGSLRPEVHDILDLVLAHDLCLATGHVSNDEALALCREARRRGARKLIFTHADFFTSRLPLAEQKELADLGVFIEKTLIDVDWGCLPLAAMLDGIRKVGVEQCVLATDYGQLDNPFSPVQGMLRLADALLEAGFSEREIRRMLADTPRALLNLE